MDDTFVKVGRASDIAERRSKVVHLEGEEIALWRVNGCLYAINNVCPHQHIPALHQGTLDGLNLTCPMHGWTYSLETGVAVFGNGRANVYEVRNNGENILMKKPSDLW